MPVVSPTWLLRSYNMYRSMSAHNFPNNTHRSHPPSFHSWTHCCHSLKQTLTQAPSHPTHRTSHSKYTVPLPFRLSHREWHRHLYTCILLLPPSLQAYSQNLRIVHISYQSLFRMDQRMYTDHSSWYWSSHWDSFRPHWRLRRPRSLSSGSRRLPCLRIHPRYRHHRRRLPPHLRRYRHPYPYRLFSHPYFL